MQLADLTTYSSSNASISAANPTEKLRVRSQLANQDKNSHNNFSAVNLSNFIIQRPYASVPFFFTSIINQLRTILTPTSQLTSFFLTMDQGSRVRSLLQGTISLQQLYSPEFVTAVTQLRAQLQQTQSGCAIIPVPGPVDLEQSQDKSSEHHSQTNSSTSISLTIPNSLSPLQTTEKKYLQQQSPSYTTQDSKRQLYNEKTVYQPYEKKQNKKEQEQISNNFLLRLIRWSLNLVRELSLRR